MFIFYEFRPFLYRQRARYLSKNTVLLLLLLLLLSANVLSLGGSSPCTIRDKKRINIHKQNNTKNTLQTIQNTVNTSTHITKIPPQYKTHTYTQPHITKQVKTTTLHDTHQKKIVTIQSSTLSERSP